MANTKTAERASETAPAAVPAEAAAPSYIAPAVPKQLSPQEIQPEGIKWTRWDVFCNADHSIEDCLDPLYLFAKAEQMRPGDYVEIKHPFGHFVICLDIVHVDLNARGVVSYVRHVFDYRQAGAEKIKPNLRGAHIEKLGGREWSIVDGRHVVADNFATRAEAEEWLAKRKAN